jgi:hypothetical protein
MKISSTKIRCAGVYILIGILFGVAIGLGLSGFTKEEKQPILFYYADNYSGELTGTIYDKNVYTIIDENGNHYIVPKDTYNRVNEGNKLSTIVK